MAFQSISSDNNDANIIVEVTAQFFILRSQDLGSILAAIPITNIIETEPCEIKLVLCFVQKTNNKQLILVRQITTAMTLKFQIDEINLATGTSKSLETIERNEKFYKNIDHKTPIPGLIKISDITTADFDWASYDDDLVLRIQTSVYWISTTRYTSHGFLSNEKLQKTKIIDNGIQNEKIHFNKKNIIPITFLQGLRSAKHAIKQAYTNLGDHTIPTCEVMADGYYHVKWLDAGIDITVSNTHQIDHPPGTKEYFLISQTKQWAMLVRYIPRPKTTDTDIRIDKLEKTGKSTIIGFFNTNHAFFRANFPPPPFPICCADIVWGQDKDCLTISINPEIYQQRAASTIGKKPLGILDESKIDDSIIIPIRLAFNHGLPQIAPPSAPPSGANSTAASRRSSMAPIPAAANADAKDHEFLFPLPQVQGQPNLWIAIPKQAPGQCILQKLHFVGSQQYHIVLKKNLDANFFPHIHCNFHGQLLLAGKDEAQKPYLFRIDENLNPHSIGLPTHADLAKKIPLGEITSLLPVPEEFSKKENFRFLLVGFNNGYLGTVRFIYSNERGWHINGSIFGHFIAAPVSLSISVGSNAGKHFSINNLHDQSISFANKIDRLLKAPAPLPLDK